MLQYYTTLKREDNALLDSHIIDFSLCFCEKSSVNPSFLARTHRASPAVSTGSSVLIHFFTCTVSVLRAVQAHACGL